MSASHPPLECRSTLSLTERRLFSLYMLYPELNFDTENHGLEIDVGAHEKQTGQVDSSPVSTVADEGDTSHLSGSTAHTTPLRLLYPTQFQETYATDTIVGYLHRARRTDLPEECRLSFMSLAQSIGTITTGLLPSTSGRYLINNTYFVDQCSALLREVRALSNRTEEQVCQIGRLRSLIIFKAMPPDDVLWAVYRQRALLIIQFAALPCPDELYLVDRLARLYHSVIYRPVQILIDDEEIESTALRLLNGLYDAFFTWSTMYRQWCRAMKNLRERYMAPLVERMLGSGRVWSGIQSMQQAKREAQAAIGDPMGPSMLPMDERTLQALNLSARRKETGAGAKTKSRRQKTV